MCELFETIWDTVKLTLELVFCWWVTFIPGGEDLCKLKYNYIGENCFVKSLSFIGRAIEVILFFLEIICTVALIYALASGFNPLNGILEGSIFTLILFVVVVIGVLSFGMYFYIVLSEMLCNIVRKKYSLLCPYTLSVGTQKCSVCGQWISEKSTICYSKEQSTSSRDVGANTREITVTTEYDRSHRCSKCFLKQINLWFYIPYVGCMCLDICAIILVVIIFLISGDFVNAFLFTIVIFFGGCCILSVFYVNFFFFHNLKAMWFYLRVPVLFIQILIAPGKFEKYLTKYDTSQSDSDVSSVNSDDGEKNEKDKPIPKEPTINTNDTNEIQQNNNETKTQQQEKNVFEYKTGVELKKNEVY